MPRYRRIRQKPIPGGRTPLPACVLKDIWNWVEKQSIKWNVSRSFVIATALAQVAGIEEQEDYKKVKERKAS
jgi:hypothetical protein